MSALCRLPARLPVVALLLMLLPLASTWAEPLDSNCFQQCPVSKTDNRILSRPSHTLSNNAATKFADWVAYEVVAADIGKSQRPDPLLPPEETLEPADYNGAHAALKTDRGHQAPLASFTGAPDWETTNYLSNITPQKSALNQGPWKNLEEAVRALAKSGAGAVHVITGPLYERDMPPLPDAVEAAGFVLDQETPRDADYCDTAHAVPVAVIARRSGLTLAPGLESGAVNPLRARLGCAAVVPPSEAAPRS